jgi:hypothetical protein
MNLTRIRAGAFALGLLLPSLAFAQSTPVYQSGTMAAPHNLAKITRNGQVQDAGGLSGDALGRGLNPFLILDSLGDGFCTDTAARTGTYHSLCIGHNASGAPTFKVDGTSYPFLGLGNGNVVGPSPSTNAALPCWANTAGTLLADCSQATLGNAGPGSSAFTGARDYLRVSIGSYPTTSEFAGDGVATIGSVQGIVGAVVQPANVSPTVSAWFGVAGYSACNTSIGVAGSCTGVSGNGVALGAATSGATSLVIGLNGVATNAPTVSNTLTRTGKDYVNISGAEIDVNMMKLAGGTAPHANIVGISIVGASETAPLTGATDCGGSPCIAAGIFLNPMGLSPVVGWLDGIRMQDGSTTRNGISLGAACQATALCSAQRIQMDAYSAAGAGNLVHASLEFSGGGAFIMNAPTGGQVALQVNSVNLFNVLSTGVSSSVPITAATHYGGILANSALALKGTSNGAPAGDQISLNASTTYISTAAGVPFVSFTSALIDLVAPVRFPSSFTGAVTPAFTNAPTGCTNVRWIGPFQTTSPAETNIYLAACHT